MQKNKENEEFKVLIYVLSFLLIISLIFSICFFITDMHQKQVLEDNKCKINPDSQGCVCDEIVPKCTFWFKDENSTASISFNLNSKAVNGSTSDLQSLCSIKSFMWSNEYDLYVYQEHCSKSHPKTINDIPCEELKENILKQNQYNKDENTWVNNIWMCGKENSWCLTTANVYDIAKEHGCEI